LEDSATRVERLLRRGSGSNLAAAYRSFYFAKDENPTFQIRSSWAQFVEVSAYLVFLFFNNLRPINALAYAGSPRLHHFSLTDFSVNPHP
jgi:hypothetical protein